MIRELKIIEWEIYKRIERITKKKYAKKKYCGQKFIDIDECNKIIYNSIKENKPFMAGRFGGYELNAAVKFEYQKDRLIPFSKKKNAAYYLCMNAGFFPKQFEMIYRFSDLMKDLTKEADLLAIWYNPMEDYWINKYRNPQKFPIMVNTLRGLEPWYSSFPWSLALEGKSVLVIHPFAESIKKQYKKKDKIFNEGSYLPDFELKTLRAVQSIGGGRELRIYRLV